MRKAFDDQDRGVLEIKPIDEIVPEGLPSPQNSKTFKHEEVFVNKKLKGKIEVDEDIVDEEEEVDEVIDEDHDVESITQEPVKRGRGKRGKDKKPREKKPPTEKQLAHLAKCRELSKQRREAKKLETQRIKLEIKKRATENTKKDATIKPPDIINKTSRKKQTQVIQDTPTPTTPHQNNINPTNISQGQDFEQFFSLMERYEEYKEKKQSVKKAVPKPQPLPTGRKIEQKYKPEPINPLINEPTNPFDVCFSYGGYS
tara:strand:+ start:1082 stop:1852 length:771 start_codon:yes stop_codon:yes gene_type:complete